MLQAASKYANDWARDIPVQPQPTVQRVTRTTRKVNQHRKIMVQCGLGVFAYAVLLVFLCSKSASLGYDIETLNKQIQTLETENHRLEYQIAHDSSLSRIEMKASTELGMKKAETNPALAMEVQPEPVQVASQSTSKAQNQIGQKPLLKIYNSLLHLAQNI